MCRDVSLTWLAGCSVPAKTFLQRLGKCAGASSVTQLFWPHVVEIFFPGIAICSWAVVPFSFFFKFPSSFLSEGREVW